MLTGDINKNIVPGKECGKNGGVRAFNKIAKLSFLQMGLEVMIYTFLHRDKHINKKLRKCSQCQMRSHLKYV